MEKLCFDLPSRTNLSLWVQLGDIHQQQCLQDLLQHLNWGHPPLGKPWPITEYGRINRTWPFLPSAGVFSEQSLHWSSPLRLSQSSSTTWASSYTVLLPYHLHSQGSEEVWRLSLLNPAVTPLIIHGLTTPLTISWTLSSILVSPPWRTWTDTNSLSITSLVGRGLFILTTIMSLHIARGVEQIPCDAHLTKLVDITNILCFILFISPCIGIIVI